MKKTRLVFGLILVVLCAILTFSLVACGDEECEHSYTSAVTTNSKCESAGVKTYTCSLCGDSYTESIAAKGHDEVSHEAKAPTCTEHGWDAYVTCSRCDYTTYVEKAALGHTEVVDEAVAPTCTEKGLTAGKHCSACDAVIEAQTVVDALGHSEGAVVVESNIAPDCVNAGSYENAVYCTVCEAELSREKITVNALGHTEVIDDAVAPTCTETGLTEGKHCSVCEEVLVAQTIIDALGHTEGTPTEENRIEPTCTEDGRYDSVVYCSVCDDELLRETKAIAKLGHTAMSQELYAVQNDSKYPFIISGNQITSTNKDDNSDSTYTITAKTAFTLELEYKVSSEPSCDFLKILYNSTEMVSVAGTWQTAFNTISIVMKAGDSVTIIYSKDSSKNVGDDCAFVNILTAAILEITVEENRVEPTCTEDGHFDNVVYCKTCNAQISKTTQTITKLGHTEIIDEAVAPTCTESGLTAGKHCSVCNETLVAQTVVPATGHSFGDWYVTIEPTESKNGEKRRDCKNCDEFETGVVAPLNHDHARWEAITLEAVAPTCTKTGLTEGKKCSGCGEILVAQETVKAIGHNEIPRAAKAPTCTEIGWDAYVTCSRCDYTTYAPIEETGHSHNAVVTNPTCTEKGYTTHTCHCGDTYVDTYVDALGHTEVADKAVAPECTNTGLTEGKHCSVCDTVLVAQTVVPANGHSFGEWYITKEPTEAESGAKRRDCKNCDHFETGIVAPLNHDHARWETITLDAVAPTCTQTGLTEGKKCSGCGEILVAQETVKALGHDEISHDAKAPTCTEKGWDAYVTCSRCTYTTYVEKPALDHDLKHTDAKAPTCTEIGWDAYDTCSRCTYTTYVEKPALEHDLKHTDAKAPTCTEIGWDAYDTCSRCTYTTYVEKPALDHDLKHTDAKAPTCTEIGWDAYDTCSRCTYTTYVEKSALDHDLKHTDAKAPTCTEIGWDAYDTCQRTDCGYTTYAEKSALDHDLKHTDAKAPTCTEIGWDAYDTCSRCDYSTYVEKAALGHTEVVDEAKAPTCTETGLTEGKHCSGCEEVLIAQTVVDAFGHTEIIDEAVAPTCTETGLTEGKHCSVCNETLVAQNVVPATGHTFGDWYVTIEPTESKNGEKRRDCKNCDEFETGIVAPLDHDHTRWEAITLEAVAPTCTKTGLTEGKKCSGCGEIIVEQQIIAANGHSYESATTTPPTCTEKGYTTHTCHCGHTYIGDYVDALGHTEVVDEAVAPTCTETGLTAGKHCSVCDAVIEAQTVVDALGHTEVVDEAVAPTCTETGLTAGKHCSVCEEVLEAQFEIPALGHSYSKAVTAPTCTAQGYTTYTCHCGHTYVDTHVDALGHTEVVDKQINPNCTESGLTKGSHCSVCEVIIIPQIVIDPLGHTDVILEAVAPTCTESGITEGKYCSICREVLIEQEIISETGHSYEDSIILPTCTAEGYTTHTCHCGDTYKDSYVDALGHSPVVDKYVAPDCTNIGLTEGAHCSTCGKVFVAQEVIPANGHSEVAAIENEILPDCLNDGYYENVVYCTVCEAELSRVKVTVDALGHTEGAVVVENNIAPDCVSDGSYENVVYCTVCEAELSRVKVTVDALGHTDVIDEAVAPTCTKTGFTAGKHCSVCEAILEAQTVVDALGHDYIDHEAQEATCTEIGWDAYRTCDRCDYNTYVEIPALGHRIWATVQEEQTITNYTTQNATNYPFSISGNLITSTNKGDSAKSTSSTFTITAQRAFTLNLEYKVSSESSYDYLTIKHNSTQKVKVSGTSTTSYTSLSISMNAGDTVTITYSKDSSQNSGSDCAYVRILTEATTEIAEIESLVNPTEEIIASVRTCKNDILCGVCNAKLADALGHNYVNHEAKAPTCTDFGWNAYQTCSSCDYTSYEKVAELGHTYVSTITPPTATENGLVEYDCSVCGYSYSEELVPSEFTVTSSNRSQIGYTSKYAEKLIIPAVFKSGDTWYRVTSIGGSAFKDCTGLKSVTIPDSVTSIGYYAFSGCTGLEEIYFNATAMNDLSNNSVFSDAGKNGNGIKVVIGKNVTKIPAYLFYPYSSSYSPKIVSVEFEEGSVCESIGNYAFYNCTGLTSVVIPDSVTSIGEFAFRGCTGLTSVTIGNGVANIDNGAFYNCTRLEEIYFNATAMNDLSSDNKVFYNAGKNGSGIKVVIGKNVTKIPAYLFYPYSSSSSYSPKIVSVEFEEGSVCESIGDYAFYGCTYLEEIYFNATAMNDLSSDNKVFYNAGKNGSGIKVVIGKNVTKMPAYLFYPYSSSSSYSPKIVSVEFEEGSVCESIGNYAFYGCTYLEEIYFNATAMNDLSSDNYVFYNAGKNGNGIKVVIGKNVTKIPAYLFYPYSSSSSYSPKIVSVEFEEGSVCESIGKYAFYDCTSLKSVTIGNSVTSIGLGAFRYCTGLTSITVADGNTTYKSIDGNLYTKDGKTLIQYAVGKTDTSFVIPNGVTSIGNYAFSNCTSLTSITIPNGVTSIGSSAFNGCTGLTSMTIPDSVTSIGSSAFSGCSNLTSITLPFVGGSKTATSASSSTLFGYIFGTSSYSGGVSTKQYYSYTSYNTYYIPSSLKNVTITGGNILYGAFYYCTGLTSITIPDSVTSIGWSAFYNCKNLTSITIPDSVTSIGKEAFCACTGLTSISIPNSVTSIGSSAFKYCTDLEEIYFNATAMNNLSSDNYVFRDAGTYGNGIKVVIGKNVTKIPAYLFYPDSSSSSYSPKIVSVEFEEGSVCESIGNGAFYYCTSLTSVTIGNGVTSIGNGAFSDCTGLTSVIIGNGVTSIGHSAFYKCTGLKSVTIGNSVTSIGWDAFEDCTGLTSITIPDSVTSIGEWAFKNCTYLTIYCEATSKPSGWNSEWNYSNRPVVWGCIDFGISEEGLLWVSTSSDLYIIGYRGTNTDLIIPETINGNNVTSIGNSAFYKCTGLKSVTIGNSVTNIGSSAFKYCTGLTSVTIGNGVANIDNGAFYECTGLEEIYFNATAMNDLSSYNYVFYNAGQNGNGIKVVIGKNVTKIPAYLFYPDYDYSISYSPKIVSVEFEEGSVCKSIGSSAFKYCTGLTSIKYCGTSSQWSAISMGSSWDYGTGSYTITYNYKGE